MTKLSIEIEDVKDKKAWGRALRKIFRAIEENHGWDTAYNAFTWAANDPESPRLIAEKKFKDARGVFVAEDLRLVLEYYAMPRPNKEKLAANLARKNETLPRAER
jgi:hypothetical protein